MYMNISSPQLFTILDDMIFLALETISRKTDYIKMCMADLVNYQFYHKKRKISNAYSWADSISFGIAYLQNPDAEYLRSCKLDRGFLISMLEGFLEETAAYERAYIKHLRDPSVVVPDLRFTSEDILCEIGGVRYLHGQILEHKHKMVDAYDKYMKRCAHRDAASIPLPIDVSDLIQNYFLVANKAIDHFDLDKGAFKSYLDIWLKKMLHSGNHFYGSSYKVPTGVKANHLSVNLETLVETDGIAGTEQQILDSQIHEDIRFIIQLVDPDGLCEDYASTLL